MEQDLEQVYVQLTFTALRRVVVVAGFARFTLAAAGAERTLTIARPLVALFVERRRATAARLTRAFENVMIGKTTVAQCALEARLANTLARREVTVVCSVRVAVTR